MLGDNIKSLRKQKGYSQETLAEQLNVVRQTVSKWEKGYSVPDAEMLEKIANLFEVPVSEILAGNISEENSRSDSNNIANQLAILNEHLAKQASSRKRTKKIILISIIAILLFFIVFYIALVSIYSFNKSVSTTTTTVELQCTLDNEEYLYQVTYDDQYNIVSAGGSAWIADHVQTEQYSDANILIAQIEDYFILRGGSCEVVENMP